MADIETLIKTIENLALKIAPLSQFADQWMQREQRPGLYNKFPVAAPFRPKPNQCRVVALAVADTVVTNLEPGLYDLTADNDCFIALNAQAQANGGYMIRGGLAYGSLRIAPHDTFHVVCPAGAGSLYLCPVE